MNWVQKEVDNLKSQNLYNNIPILESPVDSKIKIDGKVLLNFCSNNYLGLANHPKLINGAIEAIKKFGVGPAAVRSIAGTTLLHKKLEVKLAKF